MNIRDKILEIFDKKTNDFRENELVEKLEEIELLKVKVTDAQKDYLKHLDMSMQEWTEKRVKDEEPSLYSHSYLSI